MKLTATINPRESDKIMSHRKEKAGIDREYVALDPKTGRATVIIRTYWPGSVCYACVWIHGEGIHARGAGKAGGYGYCKSSAAIHYALADAGVTLSDPIDGRGESAIREALAATARAATGKRKFFTHIAHAYEES